MLDNPEVKASNGRFNRNNLKDIWHEEQYEDMRGELLQLMMKFELCYEISGNTNHFISPQLLSSDQPEYDWDKSNNLILRYTYPDFMPKGIISRFIVVMHQDIDQQELVWKTGVVLHKDNTKAEVIEDFGKREIKIRVSGNNKQTLMTIVTHELDKINDSYKRLKYQKLIPCNCDFCKNSQHPYAYEFKELLERLDFGKLTIECGQRPYHEVQVFSLIANSIDIKQLIAEDRKDIDQSFLLQVFGDVMAGDRNTKIGQGNNNENIARDFIDQGRDLQIADRATVNASGAGSFNLGNINGEVANTINQLPSFDDEPSKKELKQLLSQLQNTVLEENLEIEDQEETLEQIQAIAEALQNSCDRVMQKSAKRAMKMLRGTAADLSARSAMVKICNQLPDLISKIF